MEENEEMLPEIWSEAPESRQSKDYDLPHIKKCM